MANEKRSEQGPHIPPPLDPFPTYQTPYSRSSTSSEDENPFIQFRRFADQQFSSLFNSLGIEFPAIFNHSSWSSTESWDEMCRARRQIEEGWKKEMEQQFEEMRALQDQMRQMAFPEPKVSEKPKIENCPAFQHPATELDLYEVTAPPREDPRASRWDRAARCSRPRWNRSWEELDAKNLKAPDQRQTSDSKDQKSAEPHLGYDGKQRLQQFKGITQEAPNDAVPFFRRQSRRYDPIGNPDQTMPWLLIDHYSPIYLCNPNQSRLIAATFHQTPFTPLSVFNAIYRPVESTEIDQRLARAVPWADAFEDLASIHNTGKMSERNYSTWRTPDDWVAGMVGKGVLKGWQLDDTGRLVRNNERATIPRNNGKRMAKKCRAQVVEGEDQISASDVTDAIQRAYETQSRPHATNGEYRPKPNDVFSSVPTPGEKPDSNSIVSTITHTNRRTLEDGGIETRRTLKKRFADGREESEETVEHENAPGATSKALQPSRMQNTLSNEWRGATSDAWDTKPFESRSKSDKKIQTSSAKEEETLRKGGWFWK